MAALSLVQFAEWAAYAADPSARTFGALIEAADSAGLEHEVAPALYESFRTARVWKTAQHLAQQCLRLENLTHAEYFAMVALDISGGDAFARISLANVCWQRRLPNAVLHQTFILQRQVKRVRHPARRRLLQGEIAELNVRAYAYLGQMDQARRWLRLLQRRNRITIATGIALLFGARRAGASDLHHQAAAMLTPHAQALGGHGQGAVLQGLRLGLLSLLRNRP